MTTPSQRSDLYLAAEAAMTDAERAAFLERFTAANRHWRGAQVADVLETLDNGDAFLEIREPLYEANGDAIRCLNARHDGLFTVATLACVYLHGYENVTFERVRDFATRVGPLICPREHGMKNGGGP